MGLALCPCLPKRAIVYIAVWGLVFSLIQIATFAWQIVDIGWYKERAAAGRLTHDESGYTGRHANYTPDEVYYTAIYAVEIVLLVAGVLVFLASLLILTAGIRTNKRRFVWPWFPPIVLSCLMSLVYCALWWAFGVTGSVPYGSLWSEMVLQKKLNHWRYFAAITAWEFVTCLLNAYLCVPLFTFSTKLYRERHFELAKNNIGDAEQVRPRRFASSDQINQIHPDDTSPLPTPIPK